MKKTRPPQSAEPQPRPARVSRLLLAGLAVAAVLGGLAAWRLLAPAGRGRGPIVLVSVDTLRADRLPAYGYSRVRTPAIDALAADGVVFERAYAHSPQTLPSHASILTGRLPFETGVRDNVGFTLPAGQPTLAELLRARGMATAGVVSAFVLRKESGINRGFDYFDDQLPPTAPDKPMGQVQRDGEASLAAALRWMEGRQTPFFLFFHIYEPHTPYAPPARFAQYEPYDGEVAWSDEIVGRLMSWLKDHGLYDNATVVFLSDHGEGLGDHGEKEHGLFLYDATIRVPLIVKLPGGTGAGRRVTAPVQHIDLVPTLLAEAGVAVPSGLRGRNLLPLLQRPGAPSPADAGLYAESFYGRYHFGWSELYALTDARYRYVKAPRPELYDLQNDPAEARNLAPDRPQVVTAARAALDRLLAGAARHEPARVSAEDLQRLQALGYVGTQAAVSADTPGESLPDPKDKAASLEAFRTAIELAAKRQIDPAIDLLKQVLRDNPTMKDGWLQLGVELVRSGRYGEAVDAFKQLVEVDPSDANSFVSVAGALAALGRMDEAIAQAAAGLEKAGPADTRARTSACEVLVRAALARNDAGAARRYAAVAEQADAGFPLGDYVEGRLLHGQRQFAEALPRFENAVRRQQGQAFAIPELNFYAGDTLANLGREQEAEAAFKEELRFFPQNTRARTSLAALYRAAGRTAESDCVLDELVRAVPTPAGYDMAIRVWTVFGEKARAEALRAEAARRFGARVKS